MTIAAARTAYTFTAQRKAGALTLTGFIPDEDARKAILTIARRRFFGDRIVDRLSPAEGAPESFLTSVGFGLEQLAQLASGEAAVSDTSLRVSGEALYLESAEQMRGRIADAAPAGWSRAAAIRVRGDDARLQAEACREGLGRVLWHRRVTFETASDVIAGASESLLGSIAGVLRQCPKAYIEIAGHAVQGNADENPGLSLRRARAVFDRLARMGVETGRLSAIGYGDAPSSGAGEGAKAGNQNVELIVQH
jgi:OOP family OmpA-OmpF porin